MKLEFLDREGGVATPGYAVLNKRREVAIFWWVPKRPGRTMLPPWAAFRRYDGVTGGWRQGNGEVYMREWGRWFGGLGNAERAGYAAAHPAPGDGSWHGFYERVEASLSQTSYRNTLYMGR